MNSNDKKFFDAHLEIPLRKINDIDPFEYIQNWSKYRQTKNLHAQFSFVIDKISFIYLYKFPVEYSDLYNEVNNSDYIIINLDPNNKKDDAFKNTRVSGSVQLSYGFLKPVIICKDFAKIYYFNSKNSFLYENWNFVDKMRNAITIGHKRYEKMQKNLKLAIDKIYKDSLNNVNNCLQDY